MVDCTEKGAYLIDRFGSWHSEKETTHACALFDQRKIKQ